MEELSFEQIDLFGENCHTFITFSDIHKRFIKYDWYILFVARETADNVVRDADGEYHHIWPILYLYFI